MRPTVTPWFPAAHSPVRTGLYQVLGSSSIWWAYWDNDECLWGTVAGTQAGALNWRKTPSMGQSKVWRGILKPTGDSDG